jgi:hypothetical protein
MIVVLVNLKENKKKKIVEDGQKLKELIELEKKL